MKPDWDKLTKEFEGSDTALIADVDCTAEGKPLCDSNGVKGFPTIKYGDPSNLEKYEGGRDYKSLKAFAEKNLKPMCSPANIDLCDDKEKAEIQKLMDMDDAELNKAIEEGDAKLENAEKDFKTAVEGLQKTYEKLQADKETAMEEVKNSGLGLMKAVKAAKLKSGKDEL
jgi:hypothetical protein